MKYACAFVTAITLLIGTSLCRAADPNDILAAARAGDREQVVALLDASPELVHARTAAGETLLHYAALGRQTAIIELLLARGADVQACDEQGRTALHVAATSNDGKLLEVLLLAGARVNATDNGGETPLHVAARRYRQESMPKLIAAGANVNARNALGQTPLHVLGAATRDAAEDDPDFARLLEDLANLLLQSGADPTLRDNDGRPAWPHEKQQVDQRPPAGYPTYTQIDQLLHERASQHPGICQIADLGVSVQGRHLWALNITDNPGADEDEPEFKYVGGIHGDEVVVPQMCIYLIDYLLTNYGTDPRVTNLVDELDLWVVPLMNPDGYQNNARYNANGIDLNRNFPEGVNGDPNSPAGRAPETAAIMNWSFARSFVCGVNFHGGEIVVNYPFDNDGLGSVYSPTPDEDLMIWISEQYSQHNLPMWNNPSFPHGITNGAEWYSISGGAGDWNYRYEGCNDLTIELSSPKAPSYSQIPTYWNDNRESMLSYLETCLAGVRGIVTDAGTGAPLAATVTVVNRDHPVYTDPNVGDYHRLLRPSSYELRFDAAGYDSVTVPVIVNAGPATRVDVAFGPTTQTLYPNGGESLYAGRATNVTWQGSPTAQFQVQYTANFGQSGSVSDGFESGTLGPQYTTGGNGNWYVTTGSSHAGAYAARSGVISNSQFTWLKRPALGGTVSFWYRVSSELNGDYFNFYVDNQRKLRKSGTVNWTSYSTTLTPGTHVLKWEYVKDSSASGGSDTVWIDDLTLVEDQTAWTDIVALTPPGATSAVWAPPTPGNNYKVRARAYYGNGAYGAWDESNATFTVVNPPYALGDLNCDGAVNAFDIDPFVLALTDPQGYGNAYPACDRMLADCNQDAQVNAFDIDPFVYKLTHP